MNEPINKIFRIDSRQMEQESRRVVDSILGIDSASDQLIKTLRGRITTQKNMIGRLEKDFARLERKSSWLKPGSESEALKTQLFEVKELLEREKKALAGLETQLNVADESMYQLVSIQKVLHAKMRQMKSAGQEESAQFTEMAKLAEETKMTFRELNNAMNRIGGNLS